MHRVAMRQAILIVNTFLINKNRSFGRDIISIWKTFLIDKTTISIVIKNQGQVLLLLWICFKSLTIYHFAFFSISNWFEKKNVSLWIGKLFKVEKILIPKLLFQIIKEEDN